MGTLSMKDQMLRAICAGRIPSEEPPLDSAEAFASAIRAQGLSAIALQATWLPPSVAQRVRDDASSDRRRATVLDLEARRLAIAFASAGLPAPILMKGRAVAQRYADPSLRSYVDVDLLVPADALLRYADVAADIGYRVPSGWALRDYVRYQHELPVRRTLRGGGTLLCELHRFPSIERAARRFTYEAVVPFTSPMPGAALLHADSAMQLVLLAIHYAHHAGERHKLIWLRDFMELGSDHVVAEAREMAASRGVGWMLEEALAATESLLGARRWHARPARPSGFRLAALLGQHRPGRIVHFAIARELGLRLGTAYLLSRIDPRRLTPDRLTPDRLTPDRLTPGRLTARPQAPTNPLPKIEE